MNTGHVVAGVEQVVFMDTHNLANVDTRKLELLEARFVNEKVRLS